jgi:hypothetical protein
MNPAAITSHGALNAKMIHLATFVACFLFALLPQTRGKDVVSATALSGDIRYLGHRYYPLATVVHYTDGSADYSCVVLVPWDERPGTKVGFDFERGVSVSVVELGKHTFRIIGRYVGISDGKGSFLKLLPGELPTSAYADTKHFEAAILEKLKVADE